MSEGASAATVQEDDERFQPNLFQLYDTQAARALAAKAIEHAEAERWPEALAELQTLIEEHDGEVLGAARPKPEGAPLPSQTDVHAGAGAWATQMLFELPDDARRVYANRFGARASSALSRAVAAGDRGALSRLAQRWPLTDAAERAWWALGDLEIEVGNAGDGYRAWARAAQLALDRFEIVALGDMDAWLSLRADVAAAIESGEMESGALVRIDYALERLSTTEGESGSRPKDEASFIRGPATGIAAESFGSSSAFESAVSDEDPGSTGWPRSVTLPRGPFHLNRGSGRLFPQRLGDTVFINTSRSLHALDAFDGRERWSISEDRLRWNRVDASTLRDFGEAIDVHEHMVSVAASRGVVVAPLQIPWIFQDTDSFHELKIIQIIPERRLAAFDAETGALLWDTFPPIDWDGESGSFAERMTVVGPPTIVGARVLVPVARLRGRVEFHLACFDLFEGDVLWSTPIVTGQRELNMFGRATLEFSSPPPVVVGDKVVMLTQLGLVAAVDLFTGDTLWNTIYEQVRFHAPQYYQAGRIDSVWRNAPPIVVDGTIIAAPQDGQNLNAIDLETGALLWSWDGADISRQMGVRQRSGRARARRYSPRLVLVAADSDGVTVGGTRVGAFEFARGLRAGPPAMIRWRWPLDHDLMPEAGIPVADAESVFVPNPNESRVVRVDRGTGRVAESVTGSVGAGNLLVSGGMLFSTTGRSVDARFEWRAMVDRARGLASSKDATTADTRALVRLLLERAEALLESGRRVEGALRLAEEARSALEEFGPTRTATGADLARDLHRSMQVAIRAERLRGNTEVARTLAMDALEFTESNDALTGETLSARLVLFEIERTRSRDGGATILDAILEQHASELIEVTGRSEPSPRGWEPWIPESALEGRRPVDRWEDPWRGRLVPRVAALAEEDSPRTTQDRRRGPELDELPSLTVETMSAGLFARLAKVHSARSEIDLDRSLRLELDALHAILEASREDLFDTTSHVYARSRILALRALRPDAEAFVPIEKRAKAALDAALRTARSSRNAAPLSVIERWYPGSDAAHRAAEEQFEIALKYGTPRDVAEKVGGALPDEWHPARATERELEMLVRLAETLGEEGNDAFARGLVEGLAKHRADVTVGRPQNVAGTGPISLAELDAAWSAQFERRTSTPAPSFDADVIAVEPLAGDWIHVGTGELEGDGTASRVVGLIASSTDLVAMESGTGGKLLWVKPLSIGLAKWRKSRVHIDGGRVVVASQEDVLCLDLATGSEIWRFARAGRGISSMAVSDGVAVVLTDVAAGQIPDEIHGLDLARGIELWRLGPIARRFHPVLRVGDGSLCLFSLAPSGGGTVHDLFTGHPIAELDVGRVVRGVADASWIARKRLVLPFLDSAARANVPNAIVALDLSTGSPDWSIELDRFRGEKRNLLGIIDMPDGDGARVRIAMLESAASRRMPLSGPSGGAESLHRIDEENGRFDVASMQLDDEDRLVGVGPRTRTELASPILLALSEGGATRSRAVIRAIDPDLDTLWKVSAVKNLAVKSADHKPPAMLGDGVVALVVDERTGRGGSSSLETKLMFLDSADGGHVETRRLDQRGVSGGWKELGAFGATLLVAGKRRMEIFE